MCSWLEGCELKSYKTTIRSRFNPQVLSVKLGLHCKAQVGAAWAGHAFHSVSCQGRGQTSSPPVDQADDDYHPEGQSLFTHPRAFTLWQIDGWSDDQVTIFFFFSNPTIRLVLDIARNVYQVLVHGMEIHYLTKCLWIPGHRTYVSFEYPIADLSNHLCYCDNPYSSWKTFH